MALPATETFTAASNAALQTYSGNWTINAGALSVDAASDTVYPNVTDVESAAHWNVDTFGADQYAQGKIVAVTGFDNSAIGVAVRCAASGGTYYGAYFGTNFGSPLIWLFKVVSGTWASLAEVGVTLSAGDILRLEVTGTSLTVKRNGTGITGLINISDTSIASGYAGIAGYGGQNTARLDDWEGGDLGGGAVDLLPVQVLRPRRYFVIDSWRW